MKSHLISCSGKFLTNRLFRNILLVVLFAFVVSCENDIEVIQSFSDEGTLPSQSMINARIVYTDSARLQLRITAREIHNYTNTSENYTEYPYGILAEFFDKNGEIDLQLSSKYAIYYTDKELWEAKDSVVVINRDGEKLDTEQLFWDEINRTIYSDSFVRITRPDEVITGEGFEADETFTTWSIKSIKGIINLQDEP